MPTDLPEIVRVAIEGTFNAERWVNVLHFHWLGAPQPTVTQLTDLLGILDDAASDNDSLANLYSVMDAGLAVDTLTATTLDTTTPVQVAASVSINGTSTGSDMPPMVAMTVRWATAIANRRSRGRTYFTGLNTGFLDSGNSDRLSTTVQSNMSTAANEFATAWAANTDWEFVVLSAKGRELNEVQPYREVLTASVNPLVTLQRRRRERPT